MDLPKSRISEILRPVKAAERESLNQRREMLRLIASRVGPGRVVVRLDEPAPASVLVVGSVRNPTAGTWQQGRNVDHCLDQSGGPTTEAGKDEIYQAAEKPLFRGLLKKVQVQGGARHCGMRASAGSARPEPVEGRIAECGMGRSVGAGCSKRSRCKAAREGPSEAYSGYVAASARARQRRSLSA